MLGSAPTNAEVSFSVDSSVRFEDNIGLGTVGRDELDDTTLKVSANAKWQAVQEAQSELAFGASLYHDEVLDLDDLSRTRHHGRRQQPRPGHRRSDLDFLVCRSRLSLHGLPRQRHPRRSRVQRHVFPWQALQPAHHRDGGLQVRKPGVHRRQPDNQPPPAWLWNQEDVFDLEKDGWFVRGEFDLTPDTLLFVEYSNLRGDVAATGRSFNQGATFDRAWDWAFGQGFIVWKIDAEQDIWDIGVSHSFGER